jgi:hypothetical protein
MKSFTLGEGDHKKREEKFVAYMLPLEAPAPTASEAAVSRFVQQIRCGCAKPILH